MQATQQSAIEMLKEKIKDIKYAMLTTLEVGGDFHTRPMYTHEMEADGSLLFLTYRDSTKVTEVMQDNHVSLAYSDHGSDTYVAIAGKAEMTNDRQKIRDLWNDLLKAWFPNGPDDPNVMLLRVKPAKAEYWDRPGGKMVTLFEMVKSAITGQPDQTARNEKFDNLPGKFE